VEKCFRVIYDRKVHLKLKGKYQHIHTISDVYGGIENEVIEDMKITSAISMELYIEWAV